MRGGELLGDRRLEYPGVYQILGVILLLKLSIGGKV